MRYDLHKKKEFETVRQFIARRNKEEQDRYERKWTAITGTVMVIAAILTSVQWT